ncbi:pentatricopeptide repeat-containing protein At1g71490-like [Mangifera indica]|uniref:pentatricopeptide repeat-containing protein At1g71490-like n=1 Tax=Mangifera indica TaxID=29780 RepID=UPI001CFA374B|nr:pentatricopeptide repeat-containing protein At1g71490-like [Mangifera indica]XP_044510212.1 pentatricopeptide repeat-containing protein At1g71490-like [Mangifera indica]XP_044510213.1 pentatricopeptide repeat-containing protein At1g71490-like [Mangifera indica]XP_044510214.1 pentatricopeptide repeat-containing protein At1g71490-like [Mangifera indica]XP_044510215.1 pentatricopeptide repeat-containing protein At1g71490-like [Mangifera indica]XP_044510216.1 pentatricopeptide repeat-containing
MNGIPKDSVSLRRILFLTQKCMPNKWKESFKRLDVPNKCPCISGDEYMMDDLVASLKDFSSQGLLGKAFKTFSLIRLHASSRDSYFNILLSISSLLLCCNKVKALRQGKQLHGCVFSLGLEQHPILVPKMVTFYSTFNLVIDAHVVVDHSSILHPLPWNILISLYVRNGLFAEALGAYKQMGSRGVRADSFTYPSVLKACGEMMDLGFGREVHKSINSCDEQSLFVNNALVSMYGKFGEFGVARRLFDEMLERDAVTWNTMISCYASRGMWEEAFELFEKMQKEGIELNIITWNTIAGGCLRTGNFKGALELLSQIRTHGAHLDSVAMIIGLGACSHIGAIKLGKEIHGSAIRCSCDEFDNFRNALITMYTRCRDLRHAYTIFQLIETKSIITWNSLLSGYAHMDRSEEASFIFREMLLSEIEPNYVTIASILPLCARVANLQHGKEFHCYLMRREIFKDYLLPWNSLVDMYARSGKVVEAKRVFDLMCTRDEVTYTSLIAGYGIQGEGQVALKLFEEMNKFQIKPDHVTMVAVLSACSHSGLVVEGQRLFEEMLTIYGISPRLEHFACMVDLFGRAGLLNKAKEIINKMPYKPTPAMWATLLGACRIHGNTNIGEWAAEKLLETRTENSGYYVLIANMYAAAGSWNKLAKVRTFMRDLGVRKAPGIAWVDVGSGFSSFLVGDTSNLKAKEIYPLLDGLTGLMKDVGYSGEELTSDDDAIEGIG